MENDKAISVIIAAAGSAARLNQGIPKQFLLLDGKPLLIHSIEKFIQLNSLVEIVVVSNDLDLTNDLISDSGLDEKCFIRAVMGGKNRFESVKNGINSLNSKEEVIIVHDVARPLFSLAKVEECIQLASAYGACILATPVVDTLKKSSKGKFIMIDSTVDRTGLYQAQTPQIFLKSVLDEAYKHLKDSNESESSITDEAKMVELLGNDVYIVEGGSGNIKITYEDDISIAETILKKQLMGMI